MASEIRVNTINNRSGLGTISINDSGASFSGVVTATGGFSGDLTGNATGLSGSPTLSIGAGSTSAPSLSPSGDSNTGIFFPSADTIAFAEGGAEAARIDSSGRLLVGTTSSSADGRAVIQGRIGNALSFGSLFIQRGETGAVLGAGGAGSDLGRIDFAGSDGAIFGRITCTNDATTGNNDYPGRLVFATTSDSGSSPTERMRIDSSGNVTLNGGNLVLSSGAGIDFSADSNAAGMTSELLDDYEEGTWTPSLTGDSGGSGQTYSVRNGFYVKVGTLVHVCFEVNLTNKGTISGYPIITGMPFNRIPYDAQRTAFAINWENLATSVYSVFASHSGNTQTYFLKASGTSTSATLFASGGGDIANNSRFIGAWTYQSS